MKFGFFTLGCKVNQYETQAMEQLLRELGHETADFSEECDGYIINTCPVTAVADKKNRAVIRRCRKSHPEAIIGVCGCYPQHEDQVIRDLGVDVLGGSGDREAFLQAMLDQLKTRQFFSTVTPALARRSFEVLPAGGVSGRTRAMLKVQDGCVNFCSYCIIPYTRGPVRSAPVNLAVQQAKELLSQGYKEIVVTGIEIASWGVDLPGKPHPAELIEAVCRAVPELRIRLGSLEPRIVTEDFCQKLSQLSNLCPQFHLSLQSGCDKTLKAMNRKYDTARFTESIDLLRKYFPGCALTTDLIVAFPGETEEDHRQTLAFIEKCAFSDMHIFPYSRRPGTKADKLPGQLGNDTKEQRSKEAIALAEQMSMRYRENLIGSVQQVLFEEPEEGLFTGHAPNYVKIYVEGQDLHNQVRSVKITGLFKDGLIGHLLH